MIVLHLTAILPAPLAHKRHENDILLRIATEYEKKFPGETHHFLLIIPWVNYILSKLRPKWKEYYDLLKQKQYVEGNFTISVIGVPGFKNDHAYKRMLTRLGYFLNKKKLVRLLQNIHPDLIHAHNLGNNLELARIFRKKFGIDYVLTAREINSHSMVRLSHLRIRPEKVLAINKLNAQSCEVALKHKVTWIPHPVDNGFYVDKPSEPNTIRLSLVTVSNLIDRKNLHKVIEALRGLQIDFKWSVFGDGPERKSLENKAIELKLQDEIHFFGHASEEFLQKEIRRHDIFILPSYNETFGRVYFEAMASGVPVIASKHTGIDGILEAGIQGFLVNPDSADEIKKAILAYHDLAVPKKIEMRIQAIKLASQFRWDATLEKYHRFYHG